MNRKRNFRRASEGFTLIEILLVVVIIGILAAVAVPKLTGRKNQADRAAAQASIESISTALKLYELDNGDFPGTLQGLVANPGAKNWRGPYLEKGVPKDPWGNDYIYQKPGTHNPGGFDLTSYGSDGTASGDDLGNYASAVTQ
jgi:general secretion pathway protein G